MSDVMEIILISLIILIVTQILIGQGVCMISAVGFFAFTESFAEGSQQAAGATIHQLEIIIRKFLYFCFCSSVFDLILP